MSSLLTRDEYQNLADSLPLPTSAVIDGKARPALSGDTFETINPATGQVIAKIASCGQADVDLAVERARLAFESGAWSRAHPSERKRVLRRLVKLMKRNAHELAVLETLESGKPIYDVETIDIPEALHCLEWHAEATDKLYGQTSPSGDDVVSMIVRQPLGVVACVLPWNFPILMLAWKIGPALATGNSVIVKPAEQTNMSTLRIAELAHEAGLPSGVLQIVTGPGEVTGKALGVHPDIDMVAFTGSTDVGRKFLEYSAKSNLKRIVLECGGKNPCIVLDDAENLDVVAQHVTQAVFWNMGENCSSNSRLIVHEKIKDRLVETIVHKLKEWPLGEPLDPGNRLGAIVSKEQFDRIMGYIKKGRAEGAKIVTGGNAHKHGKGYFIEPTVFDDVTSAMTIAREEIFGPVLSVIKVSNADEAIRVANDTQYGLAASIFTANLGKAHRIARDIRAGTVTINCYGEGDVSTPFGGFKLSGFGGRDKSLHAHDQYTELKTIWADISDPKVSRSVD
ncbi:aldehyde dehydrogenase [Mesorhizobium sp. L2C085B000]|uniref:aldehyde dehydrogenase n=1 Tax=Mesorhizobium sp. L2C085B000 TaxID=1287117 RepID=UPI0003D05EC4|nr:aldehyde dehydrogenase [Mesorhizobium sp. L2C085B000]ESZ07407.1 aldehyde dehydrogenase [Mesorhizobium sp. L2C085B000]